MSLIRKQLADLKRERATLIRQRTILVEEALRKNADARSLHETLGRITLQLDEVDRETATVTTEITALEASDLPDEDSSEAIRAFDEVWAELFPPERVRIAKLLIERVEYDPESWSVSIKVRDEALGVLVRGSRRRHTWGNLPQIKSIRSTNQVRKLALLHRIRGDCAAPRSANPLDVDVYSFVE